MLALSASPAVAATELVTNGGFETDIKPSADIFGWQIADGVQPQIGFDVIQKRGGNQSLVIVFNSSNGQDFRSLSQTVVVESGKSHGFEAVFKSNLKTSATLKWEIVDASDGKVLAATEAVAGVISMGSAADVDRAVAAAKKAFASFSLTSREDRIELLQNIMAEYQKRYADIAAAITEEMGAPGWLAMQAQAAIGMGHLSTGIEVLKTYSFEEQRGTTMIAKEPVGVCAFITPWNWPINQIACKVVPAIAVGCTMVLVMLATSMQVPAKADGLAEIFQRPAMPELVPIRLTITPMDAPQLASKVHLLPMGTDQITGNAPVSYLRVFAPILWRQSAG